MISVVIPVKDGGTDLVRCLEAIAGQRVDERSRSSSWTPAPATEAQGARKSFGARVHTIAPEEFHHGRTRNLGAQLAQRRHARLHEPGRVRGGRLLARAPDRTARATTTTIAGVYGRQLPHEDATPPERYFLDFLYGPDRTGAAPRGRRRAHLRGDAVLERELGDATRAVGGVPVRRGHRDERGPGVVAPRAPRRARHRLRARRRRPPLARVLGGGRVAAVLRLGRVGRALVCRRQPSRRPRCGRRACGTRSGELAWLWTTGQRRWIPYTAVYELAKFAGLQLGRRHRLLPTALKSRMSAYPEHWRL